MSSGKPGFASMSVKEDTVRMIGIIAANEDMKLYAVVNKAIRATFPKYYKKLELNNK
jgi:hypothetical protein